jgi:hypothetical protein
MKQLDSFDGEVELLFKEKLSLLLKYGQASFEALSGVVKFFHKKIASC